MRRIACFTLLVSCALPPLLVASCGPRAGSTGGRGGAVRTVRAQTATLTALNALDAYRRAGFLTSSGPVSFIGSVRFLAGSRLDSVVAVVAVSLPSRSLTFTRDGERYRATYEVEFELLRHEGTAARVVARAVSRETVRVSSLRETTRDEESVIFQQLVAAPPGAYTAVLTVRDLGSTRSGTAEAPVTAPRFAHGNTAGVLGLAPPITVHAATPRATLSAPPDLVVSARSTAIFGRDSVVRIYIEWYNVGAARPVRAPSRVRLVVRSSEGRDLHIDSVTAGAWDADGRIAAATVQLPVARLGLGRSRILAWRAGSNDTVSAPVFVSATEDLAPVSFDELLGYLRYFTTPERLQALRDTAPEARGPAWAALLRATDPIPITPEHEGLSEYFERLAVANARFRGEEIPGWLSHRGMVYSTLGEPDRIVEPHGGETPERGRAQRWEYAQHRLRLVFVEQDDGRRWQLTPASEGEFQAVAARVRR